MIVARCATRYNNPFQSSTSALGADGRGTTPSGIIPYPSLGADRINGEAAGGLGTLLRLGPDLGTTDGVKEVVTRPSQCP